MYNEVQVIDYYRLREKGYSFTAKKKLLNERINHQTILKRRRNSMKSQPCSSPSGLYPLAKEGMQTEPSQVLCFLDKDGQLSCPKSNRSTQRTWFTNSCEASKSPSKLSFLRLYLLASVTEVEGSVASLLFPSFVPPRGSRKKEERGGYDAGVMLVVCHH